MEYKIIDIALLKKARQGHEESLSILSELTRRDVLAYLNRLTLDMNLAEDLCQETMLQMLKSLPQLRITTVTSFWAWLYKTAFSRLSRQFRDQGKTRIHKRTFSGDDFMKQMPANGKSVFDDLIHKELTTAIYEAMDSIKLKYRNILALRCFQNLSYNEIALATGGSELQARLLFFRAKRSLRHKLASRGYKKKGQLLSALSLFAALTAGSSRSASAAASINAAALNVSAGTAALGIATTKTGVISAIVIAACITTVVVNRDAFTSGENGPMPVYRRLKNEDPNLLDLMQSPEFWRPSSIGKSFIVAGNGLLWTDRAYKGPSLPDPNLEDLFIDRAKPDKRAVIIPSGCGMIFHNLNPVVDGPGPDIIIAGWVGPPPAVDVFDSQDQIMPLTNPKQLSDTWGRNIYGYDLAELPKGFLANYIRVTGTHDQGPHHGFELNDIRARQQQKK
ncbi:MAG: sigma-70 family RNA polymerase sigma factor [Sedimentisphaerales bacterium]|nr:sigma-70 family RNA polymerase sigma factor [Sedimentisphaerales bacterium]